VSLREPACQASYAAFGWALVAFLKGLSRAERQGEPHGQPGFGNWGGDSVVKPWPRLPREAVAVPSLAGFKARLDGALSTLGWWKMSLLTAGGLEPDDLEGPFQPKPFYELCC